MAGRASVEWISLAVALNEGGDVDGAVFELRGIKDLGPDRPPQGEGPQERARVVSLEGATSLRGVLPTDAPLLATPYQLSDALSEAALGIPVLGRADAQIHDGRRFIGVMIAVRGDGTAWFLGDCVSRWSEALARYAASVGMRPSDLARALLVATAGPVATRFLSSPEAQTRAGP